jgi:hypothetical protein
MSDFTPADLEALNRGEKISPETFRAILGNEEAVTKLARARTAMDLLGLETEAPFSIRGKPRWGKMMKVFGTILSFVVLPAGLLLLAIHFSSDYSLGLRGWVDSTGVVARHSLGWVTALLGLICAASYRFRWFSYPILCGVLGASSLLMGLVGSDALIANYAEQELIRREELIQTHVWISYESVHYWPKDQETVLGHAPQDPTEKQIRQELKTLRNAGFTGLYIHECRDAQISVASLAREEGFTAVVQAIGIRDSQNLNLPDTQQQLENAIRVRDSVDFYCLGELSAREVNLFSLKEELASLRRKTGKPVTVSFLHDDYRGERGKRLMALTDFTVRGLVRPWTGSQASPVEAAQAVKEALDSFRDDSIPSLLTFVFYPSGGGESFSEE